MDSTKIMELVALWKQTYTPYYADIEKGQKLSFDYWIGKQKAVDGQLGNSTASVDNLIFEAIETFLPIATRANPEPLVSADPSDIGQQLAHDIKVALVNFADTQKLRRKLAKVTRQWLLNRLGCVKLSWDVNTKTIKVDVINVKKMIFDKDGYIDEGGNFCGEYLGEKKKVTADKLIEMFPKKTEQITRKARGKMGTKLEYYEWWYCGTDVFYTLDEVLLGKFKNPNWNYDGEEKSIDPETGAEVSNPIQGTNHLKEPTYPHRFLAIFSTGEQPHDNTSLILQNIPQQDKINRRDAQIDKNVQSMNEGLVVSGTSFTEEQATQAAAALRRGVAIRVPYGDVNKAVLFPSRSGLPADVFRNQEDARSELRNIFGTAGSSAQAIESQDTVRGKILVNQMDSSRIGGGVTEFIEQLADSIYNLAVQFMFVYYDEEHFITTAGTVAGMELVVLKNTNFPQLKTLDITVKEGSLVPKDPLTQRNEAIDLWSANAIDPRSLYKKLDFPDPDEAANQLILWQMLQKGQIQPQMYLPSFSLGQTPGQLGMAPGQPQQPQTGGPAISPVNGPEAGVPQQPPTSSDAVQAQSQQLIGSVPVQ